MVRLGAEAETGDRVFGRRSHLDGFVRVLIGGGGAGGAEARHCGGEAFAEFGSGDREGEGRGEAGISEVFGRVLVF